MVIVRALYFHFYFFIYMACIAPFFITFVLLRSYVFDINIEIVKVMKILGSIAGFIIFILALYRSKLATDVYSEGKYNFLESYTISKGLFKANLSFLPIVGTFFSRDK